MMCSDIQWEWDGDKKVGKYSLGLEISLFPELQILERYPEEVFDTYAVTDSNHSKIFSSNGIIDSIQCGKSFVYKGIDFLTTDDRFILKTFSDFKFQEYDQQYISKSKSLKFFIDDDGMVIWVVLSLPNTG